MEILTYFARGWALTFTLIVAIGAQNAYVLKQALKRQYIGTIVLTCIFSDVVTIFLGAVTLNWTQRIFPALSIYIYLAGAIFLFIYGLFAFLAVRNNEALDVASHSQALAKVGAPKNSKNYWKAILPLLGVTYLNPHFYLDTFFLIGAQVSFLSGAAQLVFFAGCSLASVSWFCLLGYGSRLLTPLFARPFTWKVLNVAIGVLMWVLAATFAGEVLQHF